MSMHSLLRSMDGGDGGVVMVFQIWEQPKPTVKISVKAYLVAVTCVSLFHVLGQGDKDWPRIASERGGRGRRPTQAL